MKKILGFGLPVLILALVAIIFGGCGRCKVCKDYDKEWESALKKEQAHQKENISLDAYVENSGSIDGYVNGMTLFKTDVYAVISSSCVTNAKHNYINSEILPQHTGARSFIQTLTVDQFKSQGGNRGSSDIAKVYADATKDCSKNVAMLASDFIFSPGAGTQVGQYLEMQYNDIKNTTGRITNNGDMAVVVLQGSSEFNGTYYNKDDTPIRYNGQRPFYVLLAGKKQDVALLMSKTKGATHFKHAYSEFAKSTVNYEILKTGKVGKFRPCKKGKHHITDVESEGREGKFEFSIGIDFSNLPLNDAYLGSKGNYQLSDKNYIIKDIKPCSDKKSGWTHIITIACASDRLTASELEIRLAKVFPEWIHRSNDEVGMEPITGKTFGIETILKGIGDAYKEKTGDDCYTMMKVFIEK